MSLKIGIVGLPNVGKSTLFKALTKKQVDINNYPFCTIEPNVGIVKVPDERLGKLAEMSKSEKVVPAVVEFVDIAGLVKGASEGEGLGNKFLANIREVDAVLQVVRVFENPKITHVHNEINPASDIETINTELILADLETADKRIAALEKEVKGNSKEAVKKLEITRIIKGVLEKGEPANTADLDMKDENVKNAVRELALLTMKPFLYAYNACPVKSDEIGAKQFNGVYYKIPEELTENKSYVVLDIKIEEELDSMSEEEKKELGIISEIDKLIIEAYKLMDLITFLTTGKDESRAWTVRRNSTAPEAGAAIHGDFREKFICADVINWQKLLEIGSWGKAKETGAIKTVGKDYIINDGDVVEFKI